MDIYDREAATMRLAEDRARYTEDSAIRFLLDGLDVPSLRDLHALVERGRRPVLYSVMKVPGEGDERVYRIEGEGWVEIVTTTNVTRYAVEAAPPR